MASTYPQRWSDRTPAQARRRTGSLLLAVAIHLLILLLLLRLAPAPADRERSGAGLKTFQVAAAKSASSATKRARAVSPHHASAAAHAPKPKQVYQPSKLHSQEAVDGEAEAIWARGRGLFKSSDIAKIESAKQGTGQAEVADAGGGGGGEGETSGAGAGPGGRTLYAAQWYVEPRDVELRTYLPRNIAPSSWAEIACQTAPDYRVENCRELQQSPPGSGLSRALRQAAWQFKVRPPRVNGKAEIGAWVRIHFDWTDGGISVRR
jgi:protein TonB